MDEWETLTAEADSALGVFERLSVSTSVVILALMALGIVWVVRRRREIAARVAARREAGLPHPLRHRIQTTRRQASRTVDAVAQGLSSARRIPADLGSRLAASGVPADRLALAAGALLGLLVFLGAGLAAVLGRPAGPLSAGGALVALGCLAALRVLAVRGRPHRRGTRPALDAVTAEQPALEAAPAIDRERDRRTLATVLALEDAETAPAAVLPAAPAPAVQAAEAAPAPAPERTPAGSLVIPAVPRPTYLDAPEMERPAPAPLVPEQAPASHTRLKDGPRPALPAQPDAETPEPLRIGAEEDVAALDLDRVLARRRAS